MKLKDYLIAVDLDGTLITGFDNYDKKSFRLLKKLAKNNYIVIATGRPLRSSIYYYKLLNLKTPIINYNGALIQNPTDSTFPKEMIHIDKNDLLKFIEDNSDIIETVFCEVEDQIFLHKYTSYIEPYLHLEGGKIKVGPLKEILNCNPNGAIIFSLLNSEKRLTEYVSKTFAGRILIRFWHVNEVVVSEFYSPLTSKANALKKVCDFYHIPHNKIIAIGDGHNDQEMLEMAEFGVCMENSHPSLKTIAKYTTKDVSNHGVYAFLKKLEKHKIL